MDNKFSKPSWPIGTFWMPFGPLSHPGQTRDKVDTRGMPVVGHKVDGKFVFDYNSTVRSHGRPRVR